MKSTPVAILLLIIGIAFFALAIGYATGTVHPFATSGTHYKHAILSAVLGVGALVLASFSRPQAAGT